MPDALNQYVDQVRKLQANSIPEELLKEGNAMEIVKMVSSFYNDSTATVRAGIYFLIGKIGSQSKQFNVRQLAVNQLLAANRDEDVSNVGVLWRTLSRFKRDDFSELAKDTIRIVFRRKSYHFDKLIKLVGYVGMNELREEIRELTFPPNSKKDRWAALLALSRMGDQQATQSLINRSQKLKISDDVIYELFPDLIYTRQIEVFNYLIGVLNSDQKNCFSADAEDEVAVLCGYRVMEQLAPVIDGYPLSLDTSGDIKTRDYAKALTEVRKWFQQKGTNYKIDNESF